MKLLEEYLRDTDDPLSWESLKGMQFDVAAHLTNTWDYVPKDWGYRPSPISPQEVDEMAAELFGEEEPEEILQFGEVLRVLAAHVGEGYDRTLHQPPR